MQRRDAGIAAEDAACRHLEAHGLVLLERNFRCRGGEIDLVMRDGNVVALVEVRMRSDHRFGGAAASVDFKKQKRLIVAARFLTVARPALRDHPFRFDVLALDSARGMPGVVWIKDAFRL